MNFTEIITKIGETLATVTRLEKVYNYPRTNMEGFPAAVYLPTSHDNNFHSNHDNLIEHKFTIWIVIEAKKSVDISTAVTKYLAPTVDEVIQAFKNEWNFDTDGVIVNLTNGEWSSADLDSGYEMVAELELLIRSIDNLN